MIITCSVHGVRGLISPCTSSESLWITAFFFFYWLLHCFSFLSGNGQHTTTGNAAPPASRVDMKLLKYDMLTLLFPPPHSESSRMDSTQIGCCFPYFLNTIIFSSLQTCRGHGQELTPTSVFGGHTRARQTILLAYTMFFLCFYFLLLTTFIFIFIADIYHILVLSFLNIA